MHWYDDIQFGTPSTVPENIHNNHPDKWILNTEVGETKNFNRAYISQACAGWMGGSDPKGPTIGNWSRGELYAHDILDVIYGGRISYFVIESKSLVDGMGGLEHGIERYWRAALGKQPS